MGRARHIVARAEVYRERDARASGARWRDFSVVSAAERSAREGWICRIGLSWPRLSSCGLIDLDGRLLAARQAEWEARAADDSDEQGDPRSFDDDAKLVLYRQPRLTHQRGLRMPATISCNCRRARVEALALSVRSSERVQPSSAPASASRFSPERTAASSGRHAGCAERCRSVGRDSVVGLTEFQVGPGALQLRPSPSQLGPSEFQLGPSAPRVGPTEFQLGPNRSHLEPSASRVGPTEFHLGPNAPQLESP